MQAEDILASNKKANPLGLALYYFFRLSEALFTASLSPCL
jgi:hypothetical protein